MARRDYANDPRCSTSVEVSTAGLSGILDLHGYRLAAVHLSSGWTTGDAIAFLGGSDTATFRDIWTSTGQIMLSSGVLSTGARSYGFGHEYESALAAHRFVRLRKGAAAASTMAGALTVGVTLLPAR